jgi:hypothetical protein
VALVKGAIRAMALHREMPMHQDLAPLQDLELLLEVLPLALPVGLLALELFLESALLLKVPLLPRPVVQSL